MIAFARPVRRLRLIVWASPVAILLLSYFAVSASAQPGPAAPAAPPSPAEPPSLTLLECLRIANERQPALAAARASLAAHEAGYRGVMGLRAPGLIAPDLPVRKQQASRGLAAARAELCQTEYDTAYAVIRTYYSAVYARQQVEVTNDVVGNLRFWQERIRDIVKAGTDRRLNQDHVAKVTIYLKLAESKQAEAAVGVDRAMNALREAMGVDKDFAPFRPADTQMPEPKVEPNKDQVVQLALDRRGELVQAMVAADVIRLEVDAQGKLRFRSKGRTFAAGSDIHAKPVPTGLHNGDYRPGALGIEMPGLVAGNREARQETVQGYWARAEAVVEKTRGLIRLEAEDAFENWVEATRKVNQNREAAQEGRDLAKRTRANRDAAEIKPEDILQNDVIAGQAMGQYNQALFEQILALANLERITAGGFCAGLVPPPAVP
ncbi:MAG TPA: hypothetical protein VL371_18100 [Gemmataceae bacterium]|jgi:outer membrane protein TolC|nr:hypothetical protein [Gemmataceae bacterium]